MKKIFGLVGYPLGHSLSPIMHNAAFKALGIDAEYKLFPLKDKIELKHFFSKLKEDNICGFNVTVPHKQTVLSLDFPVGLSHEAELIGAVNVVTREDNILKGHNVDGVGFLAHLMLDLKFSPENKKVALIGAGGGASAVVASLVIGESIYLQPKDEALRGPKEIYIYDIDNKKSSNLAEHIKNNFSNRSTGIQAVDSMEQLNLRNCDLVINATPIGMKDSDTCLVDKSMINPNSLVYDLIYNPAETKLLKVAKEAGAKTSNGLGMLLYQAERSFEIFIGKKREDDVDFEIIKVMKQALEERGFKL